MGYGFQGKVLYVNLSTGSIYEENLPLEVQKAYLGGLGINAWLYKRHAPVGLPATAPESVMVIGAGPLVDSGLTATPKTVLTMKGALSGTILSSPTGEFGHQLKRAGYDHVVIWGKAEFPSYLLLSDQKIEIRDARRLWGKDIYETTDELRQTHGNASVAAIGPAGENRVAFAAILVNKQATWCRGGTGAVWGAKNLKAIVALGGRETGAANPGLLQAAREKWSRVYEASPFIAQWKKLGIYIAWKSWVETGKLTINNWNDVYPGAEATARYGPEAYVKEVRKGHYACPSCILGCKGILQAGEEPEIRSTDPFAASAAFGARCDVGTLERVVQCTEKINRLGMDYATFTARLDYLIDLYRKGIVTQADCLGYEPGKGMAATTELMDLIAYRRGVGEALSGTWRECIQGVGKGRAELAATIKGVDPSTDIRAHFCTESLGLLTSHSGGHNMRALGITIVPGRSRDSIAKFTERIGVPAVHQEAILRTTDSLNYQPGRLLKWVEDYNTVMLSLGACNRDPMARAFSVDVLADMYTAVTGIDMSVEELVQAGERIWNLEKTLNMDEGWAKADDLPPMKWRTESRNFEDGQVLPPFTEAEASLSIYYEERGWEKETGQPSPAKLQELGIA